MVPGLASSPNIGLNWSDLEKQVSANVMFVHHHVHYCMLWGNTAAEVLMNIKPE